MGILGTAGEADIGEQDGFIMHMGEGFITGFRTYVEHLKLPMLANGTMTRLIEYMHSLLTIEYSLLCGG